MATNKNSDIKKVVGVLIDMLHNNVLNDNGTESFVGWCEDGDVFDNENQVKIMHQLAPYIDTLSVQIEVELHK